MCIMYDKIGSFCTISSTPSHPPCALARLGLARAYVMQNETVRAQVAYQDFITLWKEAGPDVPILREANAAYVKLQ